MRLLNGLTMLLVGALVLIVTHLGEVEALGVRKNDTMMGEEHRAAGETAVPKVVNRGKVKFQMTKSLMTAVASSSNTNNQVTRNRISRARTTQAPNSIAGRDSIENNFSKEEEKTKTTTSKVVWWTSTTTSPIIVLDSLEQDDTVSLEMTAVKPKPNATPSVVSRILPVNRFNRFRTTTPVPTPVTRDSLEQDDDDDIVLLTKATTPKSVKKPAPTQSRFSRVRTTTAAAPMARDSLEVNDVSLEVIQVNPAPALNRGRAASRGQNKLQMTGRRVMTMNRLNRTSQTPATTMKTLILADSKEVDFSLEDVALTILSTTQAPAAGTTTETAITTDSEVTTTPAVTISMMQSDERIDLSTEMDDLMTTTTQGTTIITTDSDEVGTTSGTTISKQSNEWDDLDDIFILQTTTTAATTTTTPEPTTTTPVTRPQSRGRSRMQTTTTTTNQIPRVNRVRTTMAPKISEPNESIIMAVLTTTSAPVTRNRFSRVRTTTTPSINEDSQKVVVPAAPATTTMRNIVLGNRFNRFRTTTTTTAAPAAIITKTLEKENVAPKRVAVIPAAKKSRFGNVRTNKIVPVSDDSGEKETILLGDVLKVNKAGGNNVVLVAVESEAVSQMMKTETAAPVITSTRGRLSRGRTTTTAQPMISRHSGEENVSLEDLMVKMNGPTEPVIVADVPLISRHSDEQRDHVSLEQVDKVVVPLDGGLMVLVDVSDEMPATTTLDPISAESTEKDDFTLVQDDVIISAVVPETVVVDLPDMSDEIIPVVVTTTTTTVNPISMESEELPIVKKPMTRKIVNRGRVRKPVSQI